MKIRVQRAPTPAESGAAALQCLKQTGVPFAVMMTDANMPQMHGFTLVKQLRQLSGLADKAKVNVLTSAGQRGDSARCRELGVDATLSKPANLTGSARGRSSRAGQVGVATTINRADRPPHDAAGDEEVERPAGGGQCR